MSPARTRASSRTLALTIAGAVVWLVALTLAAVPATATDPTPSPTSSPTSSPTASPSTDPGTDPSPPPTPEPPATVTFYGRGYGHGVGLSQYGARGRAMAGELAPEILAHYYASTTLATQSTATPIRVLLVSGFAPTSAIPARVYGRGGPWTVDGVSRTWPADASATMFRVTIPKAGWRLRIVDGTGTRLATLIVPSSVRIRPAASSTRLQVWFKPGFFDRYRGTIRLIGAATGLVTAINETTVELYLRGVVPVEMPWSWPAEALRAQAIAARSYATAHLHPTSGTWDVYDDGRSQVYRGVLAEKSTTSKAIVGTAGTVVRSGSRVANTMFHSSDGGATEDNENVYVSATGKHAAVPLPYLRGSADRAPDGVAFDAAAPHATWTTAAYTNAQLSALFAADPRTAVGDLISLDLSDRGVSGRLVSVTLVGAAGTRTVSGEVFRTVFNTYTPAADPYMWSTLVDVAPIR